MHKPPSLGGSKPLSYTVGCDFTFTDNRIFIIFSDIPHFVRRDIFAFAKVILRLCRSDILFTINTRKANITRLKAVYHCEAIELAVRRIELKKALAIASAFFLVGAGGFEPPKSSTTDLQSAPFGHSGTLPHKFILFSQNNGAGGRT